MKTDKLMEVGERLLTLAKAAGASDVIVSLYETMQKSVTVRDGKIDDAGNSGECGFTVTAIVGDKRGKASSASFDDADLRATAQVAVDLARAVTGNEYLRLARPDEWPCNMSELPARIALLDRVDPSPHPTLAALKEQALALDALATAYPGVSRGEGSSASFTHGASVSLISNGFRAMNEGTAYSKSTSVIAEASGEMVSASSSHSARYALDVRTDDETAQRAGKRAVEKLGASPIKTAKMPVIFDKRISTALLSALMGAVSGDAVYKGSTFLLDSLGKRIMREGVNIIERPFLARRFDSKLYDDEKVRTRGWSPINDGVLTMWTTTIESGAKLGLASTGHAGGTSNLLLCPGTTAREDMVAGIKRGLIITGIMGRGVNIASGSYSVGAEGFLIENGVIIRPVNKVTIAGNLREMFASLIPASDCSDNSQGANAPSCFIEEMMIAGN